MKISPTILTLALTLTFASCVDTTGLSDKSSRPPRGNPNGAVVVQEFGDIQCPACKTAHTQISKPLLEKYGSQIRFDFKQFPLRSIHRYAQDLAEASECAADQGKFWEFVDMAYENQVETRPPIKDWATELKLDMDLFNRCTRSHIKKATIQADYDEAKAADLNGTPTYFVNGKQVKSDLTEISNAIEAAEAGAMQRL